MIALLLTTALDRLIAKSYHLVTVSRLIALEPLQDAPTPQTNGAGEQEQNSVRGGLSRRGGEGRALSPVAEELSGRSSLALVPASSVNSSETGGSFENLIFTSKSFFESAFRFAELLSQTEIL